METNDRVNRTLKYLSDMLDTYELEMKLEGTCPMEAFIVSTAYMLLAGEEHPFGLTLNDIQFEDFPEGEEKGKSNETGKLN